MRSFAALLAVASFAALAACGVDKTQEGEAPDVDVNAAGGELPAYDVEGPDVNVGTVTQDVEVPEVDLETTTETVETPTVDVDAPSE